VILTFFINDVCVVAFVLNILTSFQCKLLLFYNFLLTKCLFTVSIYLQLNVFEVMTKWISVSTDLLNVETN